MYKTYAGVAPAYVTDILTSPVTVMRADVLFRKTQNAPALVAPGLALDKTVNGVVDVML